MLNTYKALILPYNFIEKEHDNFEIKKQLCFQNLYLVGETTLRDIPSSSEKSYLYICPASSGSYLFFTNKSDFEKLSVLSSETGEQWGLIEHNQDLQYSSIKIYWEQSVFLHYIQLQGQRQLITLPIGVVVPQDMYDALSWIEWASCYITRAPMGLVDVLKNPESNPKCYIYEYAIDDNALKAYTTGLEEKKNTIREQRLDLFYNYFLKNEQREVPAGMSAISTPIHKYFNESSVISERLAGELEADDKKYYKVELSVIEKLLAGNEGVRESIAIILEAGGYTNGTAVAMLAAGLFFRDQVVREEALYMASIMLPASVRKDVNRKWSDEMYAQIPYDKKFSTHAALMGLHFIPVMALLRSRLLKESGTPDQLEIVGDQSLKATTIQLQNKNLNIIDRDLLKYFEQINIIKQPDTLRVPEVYFDELKYATKLKSLSIRQCDLQVVHPNINNVTWLKRLDLSGNPIQHLNEVKLPELETLVLSNTSIHEIDAAAFPALKSIELENEAALQGFNLINAQALNSNFKYQVKSSSTGIPIYFDSSKNPAKEEKKPFWKVW